MNRKSRRLGRKARDSVKARRIRLGLQALESRIVPVFPDAALEYTVPPALLFPDNDCDALSDAIIGSATNCPPNPDPGHDFPIDPTMPDIDPGMNLPNSGAGWSSDPGFAITSPLCVGQSGNMTEGYSGGPIRYFDGVVKLSTTDLASDGFGAPWSQTRSWTNAGVMATGYHNGSGWVDAQFPKLWKINSGDYKTLALVSNGSVARYFDDRSATSTSGDYKQRFYGQNGLDYVSGEYVLTTPAGVRFHFDNFGGSNPGLLVKRVDAYGNTVNISYSSGKVATVTRGGSSEGSSITETWTYAYVAAGGNAGLLESVTLARGPNGGSMTTIRKVEYEYYTSGFGDAGALKYSTVKDGSNNVLGKQYYRYYTADEVRSSAPGFANALKMVFGYSSYDRLAQACADASTTIDAASNSFVDDYADVYFEYDAEGRVSLEKVQGDGCSACTGGIGTYTFTYESNANHSSTHTKWAVKTTETLPDGSKNVVYSNIYGQVILKLFQTYSGNTKTGEWATFYQHSDSGRVNMVAYPSAITDSYAYADLIADPGSSYASLRDSQGLLVKFRYGTSTTATSSTAGDVNGYWKGVDLQRGESGTAQPQFDMLYKAYSFASGAILLYPQAEFTSYAASGSGQARTTTYAVSFFGTAAVESITVTQPLIGTTQNGPGGTAYDVDKAWADRYGRVLWTKDGDGHVNYWEYGSPATPVPTKTIVDADTSITGDFSVSVPSGLSSPSGTRLRLTQTQSVDEIGRVTKVTTPESRVTHIVFKDADHEARVYPGWYTNGSDPRVGYTTGPIIVYRNDRVRSYAEVLTMSATPGISGFDPTGSESISSLETLSRSFVNAAGQHVKTDAYFSFASLTYSTSATLGTINTHFYRTLYAYDDKGLPNRTELPTGTIYRTVHDGLGRTITTWVGTDDTPTTGFWSPTNLTGTNTVKTSEFEYDFGGIGDSNLTEQTDIPGGSEADRVTQMAYDWRNRLIATKQGVESSESTSVNRPIFYVEYNNLGETIWSERYDGDTISIYTDTTPADGVPDRPDDDFLRGQTGFDIDNQGRVYRTASYSVNPSSGGPGVEPITSQNWFDHRGFVMKTIVPGAISTKYVRDGAGRVVTTYTSDGGGDYDDWDDADDVTGDAVLEQVETEYDLDSLPIKTTVRQRFHDEADTGALGTISTGVNARVSFSAMYYDKAGRTIATVDVGTNGGSSWSRPSSVPSSSDTVLVVGYFYDAAGWTFQVVDPKGLVTQTSYDRLGRTTQTIENYVNGTPSDADDKTTQFTYDGANHVLTYSLLLPSSGIQTTQYLYGYSTSTITSNDLLAEVRHPNKSTGAASSTEADFYSYNAFGEVLTFQDRNGTVHTYTRDVLGRMTIDAATSLGSLVNNSVRRLETAFDSQGNAYLFTSYSAVSGGSVVNQVRRAFDGRGQMITEWQERTTVNTGTSPKVSYGYEEDTGTTSMYTRLSSITYPDGTVIDYEYGSGSDLSSRISRLVGLMQSTTVLENYQYLGLSTVVARGHEESDVHFLHVGGTYSGTGDAGDQYKGLDRFGRAAGWQWWDSANTQVEARFEYGYDRNSNRLWRDDLRWASNGELYGYDGLNQLVSFGRGTLNGTHTGFTGSPSTTMGWTIDAAGNFSAVGDANVGQSRTHNRQNQITALDSAAPSYDANGNLTDDDETLVYEYDAWKRMTSIWSSVGEPNEPIVSHMFDALGRRVIETTYQDENQFPLQLYYNAAWQVIEERYPAEADPGGGSTNSSPPSGWHIHARYVWSPAGIDTLVLRDYDAVVDGTPEQRLYVMQDAQSNVVGLVTTSGVLVEYYIQDPYGKHSVLNGSGTPIANSAYDWIYQHQGLRLDATETLYDNRMRFYSPGLMRFIAMDPIGFSANDPNLYRYVGNGPVGRMDPSGLRRDEGITMLPEILAWMRVEQRRTSPYRPRTSGQPSCDEHLSPAFLRIRLAYTDEERSNFNRGCIGLCSTRLGQGNVLPQKVKGTRCFNNYEDAKKYQQQVKKGTNGTPVLFAVDGYVGQFGRPVRPIQNGLPNEVDPDFLFIGYDYLTELQDEYGNIVWEHANTSFNRPDGFIIHTRLPKLDDIPAAEAANGKQRVFCVNIAANPRLTLLPK